MANSFTENVFRVLEDPINLPPQFLDYLIQYAAVNPVPVGAVNAPILASTGLTGATKSSRLVGSTTSGAPTQGTFQVGDLVIAQDGHVWVCTAAGSPGIWQDASITPIQSAESVTFSGDVHLTTDGNTIEQAAVLKLQTSVSNPYFAPTLSAVAGGVIESGDSYVVGYTWVDGSGHESGLSPTATLALPNTPNPSFWAIKVLVPSLPVGVTGFHIYAVLTSGTTKRQAAPTYVSSETVSPTTMIDYNAAGAAPPASNFPVGSAATIDAADGSTLIAGDGTIRSSSPTAGIGYGDGSGSSVTQSTSKSTAVTLNAINGQITMHDASLASGASVTFTLNNAVVRPGDVVIVSPRGTFAASGSYRADVVWSTGAAGAETIGICVTNISGGSLSEAVALQFSILKGSSS